MSVRFLFFFSPTGFGQIGCGDCPAEPNLSSHLSAECWTTGNPNLFWPIHGVYRSTTFIETSCSFNCWSYRFSSMSGSNPHHWNCSNARTHPLGTAFGKIYNAFAPRDPWCVRAMCHVIPIWHANCTKNFRATSCLSLPGFTVQLFL